MATEIITQPMGHDITATSLASPTRAESAAAPTLRGVRRLLAIGAYVVLLLFVLGAFARSLPSVLSMTSSRLVGVSHRLNSAGETVLWPMPGQAAAKAGIREGDILLKANGVPVEPWTPSIRVNQLLAGPPTELISLEVRSANGQSRGYIFSRNSFALKEYGISATAYARYRTGLGILFVLVYSIPAFIIFLRKSRDWLAMFLSFSLVVIAVCNSVAYVPSLIAPVWAASAIALLYNVCVLLIFCWFPDGRFVPRWTRSYVWIGIAWILYKTLPWPWNTTWPNSSLPNPIWVLIDLAIFGAGILAQISRYLQNGSVTERLQTKWIVYGMVVAFFTQYVYFMAPVLVPDLASMRVSGLVYRGIGGAIYQLVMLVVPITCLYAVLKLRLYRIDVIINRTLIYVPLSAILTGAFAALVMILQQGFIALTGETSDLATVLATLVVVALVEPIKGRLQKAVDQRFKEDPPAIRELNELEEQVRSRMGPIYAGRATRRLLEEAVQALRAEGGAFCVDRGGQPDPIHIVGTWKGQPVVRVPLDVAGKHLGCISLGAPLDGDDYDEQERAALRRVADAIAQAIEEDNPSK